MPSHLRRFIYLLVIVLILIGSSIQVGSNAVLDIMGPWLPGGNLGNHVLKNIPVPNGTTIDFLPLVTGSGYVSEIFLATSTYNTEIIVTVDSEVTPSIDVNLADLFGDHYVDTQANFFGQYITGSNAGGGFFGGTFRLPIPFSSSIRIQIRNNSGGPDAGCTGYVIYHTGIPDTWPYTQRLHVTAVAQSGIVANAVGTILDVSPGKRGRLVGLGWIYDGFPGSVSPRSAPLEGAFNIFIDGAGSPNYKTSGTEDFFGAGFYFINTQNFGSSISQTMTPGSTVSILTVETSDTWGAQRFWINDAIRFNSALKMQWTCGNTTIAVPFTGTCSMFTTAYYYTEN